VRAYGQVDGRRIRSLVSIIILFFTTMFSVEGTRADGTPRRVLILHSYNYTFPANAAISDSLRLELARSSQPLEIEADFLGGLHDCAFEFIARHRTQVNDALLEPVA